MRRFGSATVAAGAAVALLVGAVAGPGAAAGPRPTGATAAGTTAAQATPAGVALPTAAPDFTDVDASNPFAEDIAWLAEQGITTGYADGSFRPLASVNRDAMAAFLYRLVVGPDTPAACTTAPFTDVTAAHPFCPQISWLVGEGVTTGWPDGTYRPGSAVSREAMAAFLYRVGHDGADAPACTTARFSDVPVSSPFCGEIAWLAEQGVTTGWPDGTFRPGASIERQAMAAFLHRYAALNPEDPEDPEDPDAPQVSIDDPLPGTMVSGTVTVTVSWSALADLASVALLVDGEVVASADEAPFDLTWDTTVSDEGAHDLTVAATDVEDRAGTSEPVAVVVHQGPNPIQTLEDDYTSGEVTPEDYARYAVYRWSEPDRVPEEYRVPEGYGTDLTEALMVALRDYDTLDADVREELRAYLSPEGVEPLSMVPLTSEEIDAALAPYIAALEGEPAPTVPADGLAAADPAGLTFGEDTCHAPGVEVKWRIPLVGEGTIGIEGPELGCSYTTPLATFWYKIGWATEDVDVLDGVLRDAGNGGGPNGVPDSIDEIAAAYIHANWVYDRMGYSAPARTNVAVGEFDGGFSAPVLGTIFVRGTEGLRVYLTQHELFHQFQYPYVPLGALGADYANKSQSSVAWWLEATAEWGTHQAQRDLRQGVFAAYTSNPAFAAADARYAGNLGDHLGRPNLPLARFVSPALKPLAGAAWFGPQYGAFLFAEYLHQLYGQDVILDTWQRVDDDNRPVDAIAAEVAARGTTIADIVSGYHRANESIEESYTSLDRIEWTRQLHATGGRPAHGVVDGFKNAHRDGLTRVGAGGASYLELALPDGALGGRVTLHLEDTGQGLSGDDVSVRIVATDPQGRTCPGPSPDAPPFPEADPVPLGSGYDLTVTLVPTCSNVTVIISHDDPRLLGGDGPSWFEYSYSLKVERADVVGLLGPQPEFVGFDRMESAAGLGNEGFLLAEDGAVHYWDVFWSPTGYRQQIVPTGLADVHQLQGECHGADNGWAVDTSGRLWTLSRTYHGLVTEVADVAGLAVVECGLRGYVIHEDGTLTQVDVHAPTDRYAPVAGAAGVEDAVAWGGASAVPGGYALTDTGTLLYLDGTAATPVPGVDDVAAVTANDAGVAFVRRTDGTVLVLGRADPLHAVPVTGIAGAARDVVTPWYADQGFVLTDGGRLAVVQCQGDDCSQVQAIDSGLTGVDRVSAAFNATADLPAWVLLTNGVLMDLSVDGGAAATTSTGLADVVDMDTSVSIGRYALRENGTVQYWERMEVGWGAAQAVTAVSTADDVFCGYGRCFVNLEGA